MDTAPWLCAREDCDEAVPDERRQNAERSGEKHAYCSDTCANTATVRRYRSRQAIKAEGKRRPRRKKVAA